MGDEGYGMFKPMKKVGKTHLFQRFSREENKIKSLVPLHRFRE
jgi:hypothetical protein